MTDNPGEGVHILAQIEAEQNAPFPTRFPRPLIVKPRLIDVLNRHHINTIFLARSARLPIVTVRAMALQGKPVQPVVAMQVLYGLRVLTGQRYLLTDVDISVLPYNETSE
ncbi:hypothetical protein KSF_081810 [Reticulibacter mediterranei]|uniref:Uncharacterized protein n=1 Tax=Reticulibacter mediterranei TaxID=2778369 RepID=A0A8J3IQ45_9CHLR|nr:hypothetical protein [Reticulibacter mediterranei]GHO98133.1 hypothetical protein KSF_081810 [Reticulibacter mediterranei]